MSSVDAVETRQERSRRQNALGTRPGSIPDITRGARGLTFGMRLVGTRNDERLVIRCDNEGEVWVSIQPDVSDA